MSVGPIYAFKGEHRFASNFDETVLRLPPGLMTHVPVMVVPAWCSVGGFARIAELTASIDGLAARAVKDGSLCVPGVERPFQAWKTDDVEIAARILGAPTPTVAKKLGQSPDRGGLVADLRPGWDMGVSQSAMLHLERVKYSDERLAKLLQGTGYRLLVEGNTWGDVIFGAIWGQPSDEHRQRGPCWARRGGRDDHLAPSIPQPNAPLVMELRGFNRLGRTLMLVRCELDCGMHWS